MSNLRVMNSAINPSILVFAPSSEGPVSPSRVIQGKKTMLVGAGEPNYQDITLDSTGNVWVPNWYMQNQAFGYITEYASLANGNAAPVATIGYKDKGVSENIAGPIALAFDHHGNLYVAEYTIPGVIVVFSPPFDDSSKPVAIWSLPNDDRAQHIAVDSRNNIYVLGYDEVDIFARGLQSGGVVSRRLAFGNNLAYGIAVDSRDQLYASVASLMGIGVYSKRAKGDAQPKRVITSSSFGGGAPIGLALSR